MDAATAAALKESQHESHRLHGYERKHGPMTRRFARLAGILALFGFGMAAQPYTTNVSRFGANQDAFINFGAVFAIVGVILAAVVSLIVIAKLIVPLFDATADVNAALTNESITTGDETADSIKPVFAIIVGLAILIGLVGLILAAVKFSGS